MSKHQKLDNNDPKENAEATNDSAPVDVIEKEQNRKEANTAADDNAEENGAAANVMNLSRSEDDIDFYREWLADLHIEKQYHVDAPNQDPNAAKPPPLFPGDIVCFHEIFEWLSINDIHSVGETCKRLQAIAGSFFKEFLSAAVFKCNYLGIKHRTEPHRLLNGLSWCVQKIEVYGNDDSAFHYIASMKSGQLKEITFNGPEITSDRMIHIKGVLNNIEVVVFSHFAVKGDLYDSLLQFCPNLKNLIIYDYTPTGSPNGTDYQWLTEKYPKLEHIALYTRSTFELVQPAIDTFFELNPQCKDLTVGLVDLWNLKDGLLKSKIQLDILAIWIPYFFDHAKKNGAFALLRQLYDQGFYKRLRVACYTDKNVASLPGLEILEIHRNDFPTEGIQSKSELAQLKELFLDGCGVQPIDNSFSRKFPNLERLSIRYVHGDESNAVLPFLQNCAKLTKVKIIDCESALNVFEWNSEREKLAGAHKVTVFVEQPVYLATKWAYKTINMKFIEIRRSDSYEWIDDVQRMQIPQLYF